MVEVRVPLDRRRLWVLASRIAKDLTNTQLTTHMNPHNRTGLTITMTVAASTDRRSRLVERALSLGINASPACCAALTSNDGHRGSLQRSPFDARHSP